MNRIPILLATTCAGVVAATVLALPAAAGSSHPPLTNGYVTYSPGRIVTSCSGGVPTAATVSFAWNARALAGAYPVRVETVLSTPDPDNEGQYVDSTPTVTPFAVNRGETGFFSRRLTLPAGALGDHFRLSVLRNTATSQDGDYRYLGTEVAVSCAAPSAREVGPAATVSPATCNGSVSVVLDGTKANRRFGWTMLFQPGGFLPGGNREVVPGRKQVVTLDGDGSVPPPWLVIRYSAWAADGTYLFFDGAALRLNRTSCASRATIGRSVTVKKGRTVKVGTALTVTSTRKPIAKARVTLTVARSAKGPFRALRTLTTDKRGAATLGVVARGKLWYRWTYSGASLHAATRSPVQQVSSR